MSAREAETRRRRRDRHERLERERREWICGGPLVDQSAPMIGGNDFNHPLIVQRTLQDRARAIEREGDLLAVDFAHNCWVVKRVCEDMVDWYFGVTAPLGLPGAPPTHSTHPDVTPTRIPEL